VQAFTAGAVAVLVGYASSVAIVWQALQALGASVSQAALALAALSAGQGFLSLYLSYKSKTPLLFAWSTPGAALLISAGVNDFSSSMGAFIVSVRATHLDEPADCLSAKHIKGHYLRFNKS